MPNDSHRPDVAVFIDFENVYVSVRDKLDANPNFEMIMDRCEDLGRVVIARAYADWYRYPRVTSALYANGIEPMYVPTYYYDREMGRTGRAIKNSVDMNLCIDAMKTLFTNTNIAKFVLATGDRDFIPLVNSIRQQGKEVIVIGIGGAASAHLAQSADEFIFYESLVGKKTSDLQPDLPRAKMPEKGREQAEEEEEAPPPSSRGRDREREAPRAEVPAQPDVFDTLVSAINLARERGYVCSFGSLKLLMKELMGGDFKEGKYKDSGGRPFAKFKDFVLEAERRGKVQVFTSGTVNEVFLPGEDPYKLSQFAQDIKEEPGTPVLELPPVDLRAESRAPAASNGRRRRRRSRGGQRSSAQPQDGQLQPEDGEEDEEAAPEELLVPDLESDAQAEAVFDELLDRVEEQQAESQALAALDPLEALAQPAADEEAVAAPEPAATEEAAAVTSEPEVAPAEEEPTAPTAAPSQQFSDDEWRLLRDVVGRFERPVSFQHVHDALRDARNNAGIVRTNEELRSLIKQAINSGMLERSGKGNRASYRLAPQAAELEPEAVAVEAPDQAEVIAPPVEEQAEPQHAAKAPEAEQQPEFYTPEAATQAEMIAAVAEPETPAEAAPAAPKRSRRKPAAEAQAAPAKPARSTRKKAAPAAQAAPPPEAAEQAKPKRPRRKKAETTE